MWVHFPPKLQPQELSLEPLMINTLSTNFTHSVVFKGDSIAKMYIGNGSNYETMMQEMFRQGLTPWLEISHVRAIFL